MSFLKYFKANSASADVIDGVQAAATPSNLPLTTTGEKIETSNYGIDRAPTYDDVETQKPVLGEVKLGEEGAQRIELMQQVWGKHGKLIIFMSYVPLFPILKIVAYTIFNRLGVCMIAYEFHETTFQTLYQYAASEFNAVSSTSALSVAGDLVFSLSKPVWAKCSDIWGRGEIYPFALFFVSIGLVLAATSKGFGQFAVGYILTYAGRTALNTLNTIVIADLTSTRQRGFGVNFQFFPYLIMPVSLLSRR